MPRALAYCLFDTAIGDCAIGWDAQTIVAVHLPKESPQRLRERMVELLGVDEGTPPPFVCDAMARIQGLLQGKRDDLRDLRLAMDDIPEFNRKVYEVARAIPPGRTMTYGEVARAVGEPDAARAVGAALGHNPFAPVVPCHRVLAAGGASGGFSATGGTMTKLKMLEIERARFGGEPGLFDT